jgi:hypothetical protein
MKAILTFRRIPNHSIFVEVWIGSHFWRSWTTPEDEGFDSLLRLVAEIDQRLYAKFEYFEAPFLPEIMRKTEIIQRGITLGPRPN